MEILDRSSLWGWIMRRSSRTGLMVLLLAFTPVLVCAAAEEPLRLEVTEHTDVHHEFTGTAKSYGVTITNLTDHAVTIERGILIEGETRSGWVQQAGIQAVANCGDFDERYNWKAPIRLDAHSTLAVFPWDGFLCGGQCMASCLENGKAGPGTYRFAVVIVPGGRKIASPPFTIPRP
jgi:hypothetical protein